MKVYLCISQYFNGGESWDTVQKVVDTKEKAELWVLEQELNQLETPNETDSFFWNEWEIE